MRPLVCAILLLIVVGSSPAFAREPAHGSTKPLPRHLEGRRPAVITDIHGHLHLVFESPQGAILYVHSSDGGRTWSGDRQLSRGTSVCSHPAVGSGPLTGGGVVGASVNVVWSDGTRPSAPVIVFARSSDDGRTWNTAAEISHIAGLSVRPDLGVAADGTVQVVWENTAAGDAQPDIWHAASSDSGRSWTHPRNLSNTPARSSNPSISMSAEGAAHVVWADARASGAPPDIFHITSTDRGQTWTPATNVSNTPGISAHSDVVCGEGGDVYVSWVEATLKTRQLEIQLAVSHDGGHTFGAAHVLGTVPNVNAAPHLAADGKRVAVVWSDEATSGISNVWLTTSVNQGDTFDAPRRISGGAAPAHAPDVAVVRGRVVTVWEELLDGVHRIKTASEKLPDR